MTTLLIATRNAKVTTEFSDFRLADGNDQFAFAFCRIFTEEKIFSVISL